MYGKPFRDGPEYVAAAAANIYNPASGTYALIRQLHLVNTTGTSRTVRLFVGLTGGSAGGTEISPLDFAIAANSYEDLYFQELRLDAADFLTGLASAASSVAITTIGTLHVA